jgi:hypothetical protein
MKQLFISLLFLLSLGACTKKDVNAVLPAAGLAGTTWIAYDSKSAVNNKDIYTYFTFKTSVVVERYSKYNKNEITDPPVTSTYDYNPPNLTIYIDGHAYYTVVSGNKFTLTYLKKDYVYEKEN